MSDTKVKNDHAEKFDSGNESSFGHATVPEVRSFEYFVKEEDNEADDNPSGKEGEEETDGEPSVSDEVAIESGEFVGEGSFSFFILAGDSVLEIVGPETHVHPAPSIVVLTEGVADEELDEGEKVDGLAEDDEVVSFVEDGVADVDAVHGKDDPAENEPDMGQPLFHPLVVRVIGLRPVHAVGQRKPECSPEPVHRVIECYRHCILLCVPNSVILVLLKRQHLL